MSLLDLVHGKVVFERRVKRLAALLSEQLPQGASVLDVGCGDGSVAESVMGAGQTCP